MSSETARIRRADHGDAEAARALIAELGYGGLDPETFARGFQAVLADRAQTVLVAEIGHAVVGLISLTCKPQIRLAAPAMTIDELVVHEAARGRGIGAQLLDAAKLHAARAGAKRLELHTQRARKSYARGFYAKQGFVEIDSAVMRWEGALSLRIA